jgi:ArsR family metal-binding transcriptional regulator
MTPGAMVSVGDHGTYLLVPALTLPELREFRERLVAVTNANFLNAPPEMIEDFLDITYAAVQRNHPKMTRNQLAEVLDLRAVREILVALLGAGKYVLPEVIDDDGAVWETKELKEKIDSALALRFIDRVADA